MKLENTDKRSLLMGAAGAVAALGVVVIIGTTLRLSGVPHRAFNDDGLGRGRFGMMADGGGMRGMRPTGGTVKAISGNTITLKDPDDQTITVTVDSSTIYYKASNQAKLSDIKTGDTLAVFGTLSDSKITAKRVVINPEFL